MRRRLTAGTAVLWLATLSVGLTGCADKSSTAPMDVPDKGTRLLGDWYTQGEDPDLGIVQIHMEFRAAGELRVSTTPVGGPIWSFPGTWTLDDDRLVLRGSGFKPDGEVEVGCQIRDQQLLLTSADGSVQTYDRQPPP